MNIAIFTDTYFPEINGVSTSVFTLSSELRKDGHSVHIFTVSEPRSALKDMNEDIYVHRFPSVPLVFLKPHRAATPFSLRLIRMIRKYKIDIIHTQSEFFVGYLGLILALNFHLPVVHTYHTMLEDYTHYVAGGKIAGVGFARQYSRTFCNLASAVVVPTEKVHDTLVDYGVSKPLYTIPTGVNLDPFLRDNYPPQKIEACKISLGINPEDPTILCLGRIAKEKSIDVMIAAFPEILSRIPRAKLVIVGDGPARAELTEQADTLGLLESVIFVGAVPYSEIGQYYQLGSIFMCCSTSETQGLTYYEAMAAAIPIVARRDPCLENLIEDGVTGNLFDTPEGIPDAVCDLLLNPEKAKAYAARAYENVKIFSSVTFAKRIEDVYYNTIDKRVRNVAQRRESLVKIPVSNVLRHIRLEMRSPESSDKRKH